MKKPKPDFRIGVGASSLLMILVVLALTALSMLSLSGARNTEALTARGVEMTVCYYEAAARAQSRLAALHAWLLDNPEGEIPEALGVSLERDGARATFSFREDAGNERAIAVEGVYDPASSPALRLTRHALIDLKPFEADEPLNLIGT